MSQMEATALEAGIDPQYLRAAIEERQQGKAPARADMMPRWRVAALCATVAMVSCRISSDSSEGSVRRQS